MSITIGGNVCVRNGESLDYCWRESVESLLPVCDSVTVCDGNSDDGTWEAIEAWSAREPRIRKVRYAWPPASIGTPEFWVDWLNYAREHVKEDFHLQLDADEVLSPSATPTIGHYRKSLSPSSRLSLQVERLNFWLDARHIAPHGHLCGNEVIRFAPTDMWLPSDFPHPKANEAMRPAGPFSIFHYGFLRHRDAFFEKAIKCRKYFNGLHLDLDPRIAAVRRKGGNWMERIEDVEWTNRLLDFSGDHPPQMIPWLRERGFAI
jgi:glycosyltransferase involved in cell wall biosynthesis